MASNIYWNLLYDIRHVPNLTFPNSQQKLVNPFIKCSFTNFPLVGGPTLLSKELCLYLLNCLWLHSLLHLLIFLQCNTIRIYISIDGLSHIIPTFQKFLYFSTYSRKCMNHFINTLEKYSAFFVVIVLN